jgi:hypothetical protein
MYPVTLICQGCPKAIGVQSPDGDRLVDPATIERKYSGAEISDASPGWSWRELDLVSEEDGGAPRAHRDALKLLAAFVQHSDNKPEQQRLVCLDAPSAAPVCAHSFMLINDLGLTFGRVSRTNANLSSSVNFQKWSQTPVWKGGPGCVANLSKSFTGTLKDPEIGESGRRFLADLMIRLSDAQLHDLFAVARVDLRPQSPEKASSRFPTIQEWVDVFKQKRAQIVERRCA